MVSLCATICWSRSFYIDANNGNDKATGNTPALAWKSFDSTYTKVNQPGDTILLKRGCTWKHYLVLYHGGTSQVPVVLTSYGDSALARPTLTDTNGYVMGIGASHIIVENIAVHAPRGYCISSAAEHLTDVTIQDNEASDCQNGIALGGVIGAIIQRNFIHNIHFANGGAGAIAITLDSCQKAKILHNTIRNAIDGTGTTEDGGAVELFRTNRNIEIAWNKAYHTAGFLEMGGFHGDTMWNVAIHHNTAMEVQNFAWCSVLTPKDSSNIWAIGFSNIFMDNNTHIQMYRKAGLSIGVSQSLLDSSQIRVRNNMMYGDSLNGFLFLGPFSRGNNLFWTTLAGAYRPTLASGELFTDPLITIDTSTITYALDKKSPAIGAGAILTYPDTFHLTELTTSTAPTIGALEYSASTAIAQSALHASNWGIQIHNNQLILTGISNAQGKLAITLFDGAGRVLMHKSDFANRGIIQETWDMPKLRSPAFFYLSIAGHNIYQTVILP